MSAQQTMKEIMRNHELLHLATIDEKGVPSVRGVDFAAGDEENILYFTTRKTSRKIAHIQKNSAVGFAIDRECADLQELAKVKYLKGTGRATVIEDPDEAKKAFGLLLERFPFLSELPGDPSEFVCVRVEMHNVLVSDNNIKFGHTEAVIF